MSNAILLSNNRLDYTATITVVSGDGSKSYLYDRDKATQWQSIGSNDTITEVITIDFGYSKPFDRLMLLNHNIKAFSLEKEDTTVILSGSNLSTNYFYGSFNKVTLQKVILKCLITQTANQEKKVGELMLMEHYYTLPNNPSEINSQYREEAGEINMADGTKKMYKIPGSERFGEDWTFEAIPLSMTNELKAIKTSYYKHPFSVYLLPDERPDTIYLCNWVNPYEEEVLQKWDSSGRLYKLRIDLREV